MKPARTRFAPSPTGYAHLGFVSRILINYALSKQTGGQFIWRNEDTDQERFVPGSLEFNMKWVRKFGLDWDEGPDKGGEYGPYSQSERLSLYKDAAEKLIENGYAYKCFLTKEELEQIQQVRSMGAGGPFRSPYRDASEQEIESKLDAGLPYTVRLKIPDDKQFRFEDALTHNIVEWTGKDVNDAIVMKSDGFPTYHLAVVVDDMAMEVTHALRGSEWISSVPLHLHIFEGLNITESERPAIGHFSVILDPATNKKFSKRKSSFRVDGLVKKGYLPEAILNYLMLLGWAPKNDRQLFTLDEFVTEFDLAGMQKADPTWDQQKMDWFNGHYLRELGLPELRQKFTDWVNDYLLLADDTDLESVFEVDAVVLGKWQEVAKQLVNMGNADLEQFLALVHERATNMLEMVTQLEFFFFAPGQVNWDIKQMKRVDEVLREKLLRLLNDYFKNLSDDVQTWTHEDWESRMRELADEFEVKHGDVFMVLRLALVGSPFSPPLFPVLQLLKKQEILRRLNNC